jgi:hypothetical protein
MSKENDLITDAKSRIHFEKELSLKNKKTYFGNNNDYNKSNISSLPYIENQTNPKTCEEKYEFVKKNYLHMKYCLFLSLKYEYERNR